MKVSICVVYHDREKNLGYWLAIWKQLAPGPGVTLTIIHNHDSADFQAQTRKTVEAAGAVYCNRPEGRGMDIGALQDVSRKRLAGFDYSYDFLFWFTDDCFPMAEDFIHRFLIPFSDPQCAISCLEISTQIRRHIRTTGFCMRKADVEKLIFQVDPVRTKNDCYVFEHRGPLSLYEQLQQAGKKAVQISPVRFSPVWDSGGGGHGWVNRRQEFEKKWRCVDGSKVLIIAPAYERYPQIVSSIMLQTYHNWELHLVHNGPTGNDWPTFDDKRIIQTAKPQPLKNFGHPIREEYLQMLRAGKLQGDYVLITNDDNYHAPFFLEKLVRALDENITAVGAYCSAMVHNYAGMPGDRTIRMHEGHAIDGYGVINVRPEKGYIDVAGVLIRAKFAADAGWPDYTHSSDWAYLNTVAQRNGGWNMFKCVPGCLLVHN